jgi:glycosyltransferase involved in cell wall biosynthesis
MTATLTACVIARDEEQRLPACLASLEFCDEVVVVDSGSTDRTREIAREAGALVIENPWRGFAVQRNVALDHASGAWVLEIDADERVSPELAREMRNMLDGLPAKVRMAAIPMRDVFLGRPLGPSARYPRYRHRLFRRGAFRHDEARTVHEGLWPDGPTAALEGELRHLLASSWPEALRDGLAYARLDAAQHARPGAREALLGIVVRPTAKLTYRLLLYGGWRDGWQGIARVWLECAADSLAVILRLRGGRQGATRGLGQQAPRQGPVRLVGVAFDLDAAQNLNDWLRRAADAGADVALIARGHFDDAAMPRRNLDGSGPGALARALDAEDQVRPIDALVLAGRREQLFLNLAPRALRGEIDPLDSTLPPAEAVANVQRATRPPAAT